MSKKYGILVGIVLSLVAASAGYSQEKAPVGKVLSTIYPTAILPFQERGSEVRGQGQKVTDIVFARLAVDPQLYLVDREDMAKVLGESELSLSGMVRTNEAVRVGQLTGAKILVTGSVMQVGKGLYLVAKIIGTETSRVLGASVKGEMREDLGDLVDQLATRISETIREQAGLLMPKPVTREDVVSALKEKLGERERPVLSIRITERHVGQATIDPAAQTELILLAQQTGFDVVEPGTAGKNLAQCVIEGEAFSEFAVRRGNLVSVKARVEVKAVDPKTEKVLAVDRQTAVAVDLAEQLAGKAALQKAAEQIAGRLLPKLVGR